MNMLPDRPLPSSKLVILSVKSTHQTLRDLSFWLLAIGIVAGIYYLHHAYISVQNLTENTTTAAKHFVIVKSSAFMALGYPLIMIFLLIWFYLAMLYQTRLSQRNQPAPRRHVISLVNKHYLRFCIATILSVIILFLLGSIVLPFIFAFPIIILVHIIIAIDDYRLFAAFKHAWQLVWGNWWHTFWVLFLAVFMPVFIVAFINLALSYITNQTIYPYVLAIGQLVALLIVLPLMTNTLLILYNDLRLRYMAQPSHNT